MQGTSRIRNGLSPAPLLDLRALRMIAKTRQSAPVRAEPRLGQGVDGIRRGLGPVKTRTLKTSGGSAARLAHRAQRGGGGGSLPRPRQPTSAASVALTRTVAASCDSEPPDERSRHATATPRRARYGGSLDASTSPAPAATRSASLPTRSVGGGSRTELQPPGSVAPSPQRTSGASCRHHARAHPLATVAHLEAALGTPHAHTPSMDTFTAAALFVVSVARQPLTLAEAAALLAFDPALARQVEQHRELTRQLEQAREAERQPPRSKLRRARLRASTRTRTRTR